MLQLSLYSEQLAALQGLRPELMHVALGGSARDVDHLRVADYAAYVRTVKRQFEAFTEGASYPRVPAAHAAGSGRALRDLSLAAGM